jgi:DNA-binding transcriptional LysR family regulator
MLLDPSELRLLALIRQRNSLSGAASELGLTAPAISGQVARLERRLGTTLVVRGPRGARLTQPGQMLADAGDVIDDECSRAGQRLQSLLEPMTTRLRIGTFSTAAQHLLPPALIALRHQNPDAEISILELTSEHGPDLVIRGDVDVAVIASYSNDPRLPEGLRAQRLLTDPTVLCLPDDNPYAKARTRGLRLSQLHAQPWIAIRAGQYAREQFDLAVREAGFTPQVQFETDNYNVAQALVGTGIGLAMLTRLTIAPTPGAVHRELLAPRLNRRLYALTTTDTSRIPLAQRFIHLLTEVAQDLSTTWKHQPITSTTRLRRDRTHP